MGSWKSMSGAQFLEWWRNNQRENNGSIPDNDCGGNISTGGGTYNTLGGNTGR